MTIRIAFSRLLILCLIKNCCCEHILGLFPFAGKSDTNIYHAVTLELARNGHQVTVVSPFKPDDSVQGHQHVHLTWPTEASSTDINFWNAKDNTPWMEINGLFHLGQMSCQHLLSQNLIKKWIQNKSPKFDLIITSSFFTECTGAFAYLFKAPLVQICTFHGVNFMMEMMGNPPEYASMPDTFLAFDNSMNLLQRLQNLYHGVLWHTLRNWYHLPKIDSIVRDAFGTNIPSVVDIEHNTSLLLINSHISQSYPRALVPNIVLVGGLHIKEPKQLPGDLKKWLDESKQGVVYFSMGSNLKSVHLKQEKIDLLLNVFGKLKERVLWKWEEDSLVGQPENVRIAKWLPQSDLLAHPSVKLFITHGGLLSTQEAMYHGVPVVGIPIFGDQYINMNRIQSAGFGLQLDFNNLTEIHFLETIDRILTEAKFQENAKKLSKLFRDHPEKPLKRAIFWIEYVLRHNGAKHLRSGAVELQWWQRDMLDIVLIIGLCLIFIKILISRILSFIIYKKLKKE